MEDRCKLDRIGKVQLVQLYADNFEQLTLQQKTLAYHLNNAAIAGRDISFDQKHPDTLKVRDLLEPLYERASKASDIDQPCFKAIEDYLYYFWMGNGPYDMYSGAKITLDGCPSSKLIDMLVATGTLATREEAEKKVQEVDQLLYDKNHKSILTEKTKGDWIVESAVNFYQGDITTAEAQAFIDSGADKHQLNSTLVKDPKTGQITADVWRAGCEKSGIPPGKYAKELNSVIAHLELAIPFASGPVQEQTIRMLIKYFQTGLEKDFHDFNVHWVTDDSDVDFILGFIEVYMDPLGLRAEFEGCVYWKDATLTNSIQKIGDNAQYFEDRMPWDEKYKKKDVKPLSAAVVNVIGGYGGLGPGITLGINLPNEECIRETHGSKSIVLQNFSEAAFAVGGLALAEEFCWNQEEIDSEKKYGLFSDSIETSLHEALGHASGKCVVSDPAKALPGIYSTLEEARADLVALWQIMDPKLIELGIIPNIDVAKQMFMYEVRNALVMQLRRVDGDQLEEAHMQNRALIANYILKNSKAIEEKKKDGKTYFVVVDFQEAHRQVGVLLAEVMRIKAEGDLAAGKKLVDTYGLYFDTKLRDEVKERVERINVPAYKVCVMPTLTPVLQDGKITDIKITYCRDFKEQMLSLSKQN
eukprot:gene17479-20855_t